MVKSIVLTNLKTQDVITISKDGFDYILDEIDFDSPAVTLATYRMPFQIGESLSGVTVGTRKPNITGYIVCDTRNVHTSGMTWQDFFDYQEREIEQKKDNLNKLFSIYQDIRIQVGDFYLLGRPSSPPKYSITEKENNEVLCYFTLDVTCFTPVFYGSSQKIDLATVTDLFHFPLIIPEGGIAFGSVMRRQSIPITNNGDTKAGCVITIKASGGSVQNPKVYNVNSGETFELEGVTLNDGEYIEINTKINEENVTKHTSNETVSLIGNVKTGSTFLKIEQGANYYSYDFGVGDVNNAEVSIEFTEEFFNIKNM